MSTIKRVFLNLLCYPWSMKILVTGGAGFLGSHLTSRLLDMGHEVIVADNLYTGSKENVYQHLFNPRFEFIRHDVNFPLYLEIDGIFNLACPASPIHYQRNPVQTFKTSVQGAINLIGLAKRCKVPIVQASTSEVYGDPEVSIQKENYWGRVNPIGIRACYDEGKRAAETIFFDSRRQYGLDCRVARIFNTYGPRMAWDDGRVVSNFITQALQDKPITIYGDGSQTRSFCYVDDLIEGLIRMFFSDANVFDSPINLGNPDPVSMATLAREILQIIPNSKSDIIYEDLPQDDPLQRCPDIGRAMSALAWTPQVSRIDGLNRTVDDFKLRLNALDKIEI
jgi:UDP-glucuronate decarboxylase